MATKKEKGNKTRQMKADALKRRMADLGFGERDFAQRCGLKKRDAVSKWRAGASWPTGTGEQTLERVLLVPSGFFARIAQGIPYEEARRQATETAEPGSQKDVFLVRRLLQNFRARSFLDQEQDQVKELLGENLRKYLHNRLLNEEERHLLRELLKSWQGQEQSLSQRGEGDNGETTEQDP